MQKKNLGSYLSKLNTINCKEKLQKKTVQNNLLLNTNYDKIALLLLRNINVVLIKSFESAEQFQLIMSDIKYI